MTEITELRKPELLDSLILITVMPKKKKRGGAKFGPFIINVVAEITEFWVENSQKINCRGVTSIREGRVNPLSSLVIVLCIVNITRYNEKERLLL